MFCSKCGNPLPDDAKFCSACGASVKISQEASPVPQQPAGRPDEVENIQTPKPEPLMQEPNFNGQMGYGAAAPVQKKSKKGLAIGLSIGGVVLTVILAVMLIFVLRPKDSVPVKLFTMTNTFTILVNRQRSRLISCASAISRIQGRKFSMKQIK